MASSSKELVAKHAASEGEPDIAPATKALRNDDLLPETASSDLTRIDASPATVGVFSMKPSQHHHRGNP